MWTPRGYPSDAPTVNGALLYSNDSLHPERQMRGAEVPVRTWGQACERNLVGLVGHHQERAREGRDRFWHVGAESGGGARRDAIRPERHVVWRSGDHRPSYAVAWLHGH